jgi:cytochrome P450
MKVSQLNSDVGLMFVAGSDTTSISMAMAMFELTRNPQVLSKVAEEVDGVFGGESVSASISRRR